MLTDIAEPVRIVSELFFVLNCHFHRGEREIYIWKDDNKSKREEDHVVARAFTSPLYKEASSCEDTYGFITFHISKR